MDVEDLKRLSLATLTEVKDDVEQRICDGYLPEDAESDIPLVAFRKFNQRLSAFLMSSSRDNLTKLVTFYFDGELKSGLEVTVSAIVPGVRIRRIEWSVKDFERCNKYFIGSERRCSSSTPSSSFPHGTSFDFNKLTIGTFITNFYA